MRDLDPASILATTARPAGSTSASRGCRSRRSRRSPGYCLGGGLELALRLRLPGGRRYARRFGFPEVGARHRAELGRHAAARRGWSGCARAKELVLLGERFCAEEAHGLGLLTEVVADGAALGRALRAGRAAGGAAAAGRRRRQAGDRRVPEASREAVLAIERLAYGLLAQTEDADEAAAAFASAGSRASGESDAYKGGAPEARPARPAPPGRPPGPPRRSASGSPACAPA